MLEKACRKHCLLFRERVWVETDDTMVLRGSWGKTNVIRMSKEGNAGFVELRRGAGI